MSKHSESGGTQVQIYGAPYVVRGAHDTEYLQELAALVDRTMRDIARQLPGADAGRLAILAALNLADELQRSKKRLDGERVEIESRVSELSRELDAALEG